MPRTARPPMPSVGRVMVVDVGVEAPRLATQLAATDLPVTRLSGRHDEVYEALLTVFDQHADTGVAIVAADADVSTPALNDVLLDPRPTTRLLVDTSPHSVTVEPVNPSGSVTLGGRRVTASTTASHTGATVDGRALGVLAITAREIAAARTAVHAAQYFLSQSVTGESFDDAAAGTALDPVDLLVTALVRHGVVVTVVPVPPLAGRRLGRLEAAVASGSGAPLPEPSDGSEPYDPTDPARLSEQEETDRRWRAASRADDGFYSTFAVRPVSRRLSRALGERGWSPNRVTIVSAVVGVAAAVGFATGSSVGLVLGAVALQVSLVFDCSDGEIARFHRSYTASGSWLDATTDRIKEYLALAGLAVGAARGGDDIWLLAAAAMAVQTVRHMQDFAFVHTVLAEWRSPVIDRRPMSATMPNPDVTTGGTAASEVILDDSAGRSRRVGFWFKRIIHLPIAERWLLLSVGALVGSPWLSVVLYLAADVVAWAWTILGSWRRSLRSRSGVSRAAADVLSRYRDDGPLGVLVTTLRRRRTAERGREEDAGPRHAFAWIGPPLVTALEFAAVIASALVVTHTDGTGDAAVAGAWAFGWIAAVAWHRYDVVYRWRDWRESPDRWVGMSMLGWPVRLLAVSIAATVAAITSRGDVVVTALAVGTGWFALVGVVALVPVVPRLTTRR